jgi:hypothetical protein
MAVVGERCDFAVGGDSTNGNFLALRARSSGRGGREFLRFVIKNNIGGPRCGGRNEPGHFLGQVRVNLGRRRDDWAGRKALVQRSRRLLDKSEFLRGVPRDSLRRFPRFLRGEKNSIL